MPNRHAFRWSLLLCVNALLLLGMLGFYRPSAAQQKTDREPFANSVEQRNEMIAQLKELNAQLKEMSALLQSGKLQVTIAEKGEKTTKED